MLGCLVFFTHGFTEVETLRFKTGSSGGCRCTLFGGGSSEKLGSSVWVDGQKFRKRVEHVLNMLKNTMNTERLTNSLHHLLGCILSINTL